MRRVKRQLACENGAEIAEAALVLPIAFMFLFGIVWFGRAFNVYSTITQAAQQGALTAARRTCATCGNNTNDTAVVNAITDVLQASHLDPSQISANSNPPTVTASCSSQAPAPSCNTTAGNITICRSVILNPTGATSPVQCGTIVSFQYPFQFNLPFTSLNMQRIVLTAQAQSRMEN
jgi:Flp pilus assembly protein TadG